MSNKQAERLKETVEHWAKKEQKARLRKEAALELLAEYKKVVRPEKEAA